VKEGSETDKVMSPGILLESVRWKCFFVNRLQGERLCLFIPKNQDELDSILMKDFSGFRV
jgi:hypothetical protein